jgi:hypothetical protein
MNDTRQRLEKSEQARRAQRVKGKPGDQIGKAIPKSPTAEIARIKAENAQLRAENAELRQALGDSRKVE